MSAIIIVFRIEAQVPVNYVENIRLYVGISYQPMNKMNLIRTRGERKYGWTIDKQKSHRRDQRRIEYEKLHYNKVLCFMVPFKI